MRGDTRDYFDDALPLRRLICESRTARTRKV
jgi:hypothetical protein